MIPAYPKIFWKYGTPKDLRKISNAAVFFQGVREGQWLFVAKVGPQKTIYKWDNNPIKWPYKVAIILGCNSTCRGEISPVPFITISSVQDLSPES